MKKLGLVLILATVIGAEISIPTAQAVTCSGTLASTTSLTDTSNSSYCILTITSGTNLWTAPSNTTSVNVLVVGGGGGGDVFEPLGSNGGGGGLVVVANNLSVTPNTNYAITVGSGGLHNSATGSGSSGADSQFGSITANGGGGGGYGGSNISGGSGGGGITGGAAVNYSGPGTAYGNHGGAAGGGFGGAGGGGGGAGSPGGNGTFSGGGSGGSGLLISIDSSGNLVTGTGTTYYGAGGSGGTFPNPPGSGGVGIGAGGGGGGQSRSAGTDGTAGIVVLIFTISNPAIVVFPPVPDPLQQSTIKSITPTTGVANAPTTITASGNFIEKVSAIQINGVGIATGSWVQTPTSITFTIPIKAAGRYSIQIYNGSAPVLAGQTFTVSAAPTPASLQKSPKLKVTYIRCVKPGHGTKITYGVNPVCPSGYTQR